MAKDNKTIIWIVAIIALIVVIIYGGKHDWFKLELNTYFNEGDTYSSKLNPDTFNGNFMDYSVMLQISPSVICLGQSSTGTITSNINGGVCTIFINSGSGWQILKNIQLNSQGDYSESQNVNSVGTASLVAICCDAQNNCKISNAASLTVNNCGNSQCTDSDGGINPDIPGKVTTPLGMVYDTCQPSSFDLLEFYCLNGVQKSQTIHCVHGCTQGVNGGYCNTLQQPDEDICTDSDNGQFPLIFGTCQSSVTQTGSQDECDGFFSVKEKYCAIDKTCQSVTLPCPTGWLCIGGECKQPACGGIPLPSSQGSCSVGYCPTGTSCIFVPATLVTIAKCECQ